MRTQILERMVLSCGGVYRSMVDTALSAFSLFLQGQDWPGKIFNAHVFWPTDSIDECVLRIILQDSPNLYWIVSVVDIGVSISIVG